MAMRLAAIFCVWDDWDLLDQALENIRPCVDGVVVIGSKYSNFGEHSPIPERYSVGGLVDGPYSILCWEPDPKKPPQENETAKRNYGLELARKAGFTHFVMMDADEFYDRDEFMGERQKFKFNPDLQGMVCRIETYFGGPELTIGDEGTLVPFIHKITPGLRHEFNRRYPFAWSGGLRNRRIHIDPTRSLNIYSGVEMSEIKMHHYSWVRKDFAKKIRNSTARANLEKSSIMQDLALAKEGYYVNFYGKVLRRVPNYFNIPSYGDTVPDIQQDS